MIVENYRGREKRPDLFGELQLNIRTFEKPEPKFDLEKALKKFKGGKSREMLHFKKRGRR